MNEAEENEIIIQVDNDMNKLEKLSNLSNEIKSKQLKGIEIIFQNKP